MKTSPSHNNLFADIPSRLPEELIEILVRQAGLRIERIVSRGHRSPPDFWYDQEMSEFVVLLRGRAGIEFKDTGVELVLNPGDYVDLPAHVLHRVAWTDPVEDTVWLAVHYSDGRSSNARG